ncbi:hypothetical protein L4C34_03025 [Vibrio profundum]|uniref:hypothetical protein n=1 Tax=Vibrio profundum TaxID=2910247 RepID=UPI003D0B7CF9
MQNSIIHTNNVPGAKPNAIGASADLNVGVSHQKNISNLIDNLSSLAALVNKALQMIRESIQEWRDTLSNSQAKGMMLMLNQAVSNNKMQKGANQKECDAAYRESWADLAKGVASVTGGFVGAGAAFRATDAAKGVADVSSQILTGAAEINKFFAIRDAASMTRDAKDKSADVQLQNKILETWEKQISQVAQRAGEMSSQLGSVNDQLRQSVSQLYVPISQ